MADSKLRLQIISALDNAGLKATKEQIDGIEKSIQKTNATGGLGNVEKQLGNMKGPLGKLGPMFEGLGGTIAKVGGIATMVIGAFKAGWDIGNWLQEHVIAPMFNLKDPIKELKNQNKELDRQNKATLEAMADKAQSSAEAFAQANQRITQQVQRIDQLHQAWVKATRAKNAYMNADQDIRIQQLERERFEDVMRLEREGDTEGAEQVNALYDVYKNILVAQQSMEKYDQETAEIEKGLTVQIEKRKQLMDQIVVATANVAQKQRELKSVEDNALSYATQYDWKRADRTARKNVTVAQNELRRLEQQVEVIDSDNSGMWELATREKQRAVLADKLMLGVDQSAWAYDKFVNERGNLLGIDFSEEFKQTLAESSKESYDNLEKAITEGVRQGIGQLMEVK